MKKFIISIFTLMLAMNVSAQQDVKLEINHMQGSNAFDSTQTSTTMSGENYNATRLEYYISEIALEHDGGMVTEIDSLWVLVNANDPQVVDLGSHTITTLEAIHFSIGVDPSVNNDDPALWPMDHPLAPKSPSMHWGWTAGYRFLAIEGECGTNVDNIYEMHSLGNDYYYQQIIQTAGADDNGDLLITLNADYDRIFDDITLGTGIIDHGEFTNNIQSLKNMRDYVFKSSEGNGNSLVGIESLLPEGSVSVFPNPSEGLINFTSSESNLSGSTIMVHDNLGKLISTNNVINWDGNYSIEIDAPGYYIVSVTRNNEVLLRESVIVSK